MAVKRTTYRHAGPIRPGSSFHLQAGSRRTAPLRDGRAPRACSTCSTVTGSRATNCAPCPTSATSTLLDGQAVGRWQFKQKRSLLHAIGDEAQNAPALPPLRRRLGRPARRLTVVVLQRDRHQAELALPAPRFLTWRACRSWACAATTASDVSAACPMTMPAMANPVHAEHPLLGGDRPRQTRLLYLDSVLLSAQAAGRAARLTDLAG